MNDNEKLQLNKMINEHNVKDMTHNIREKKHSELIRKDVETLVNLQNDYKHLSSKYLDKMIESQCVFLFKNYTDIYNRLKKNELDLTTMYKFLDTLKLIEDKKLDQHEGAFLIGKYLKSIYIDSALKRSAKLDEKYNTKEESLSPRKISWSEFKSLN